MRIEECIETVLNRLADESVEENISSAMEDVVKASMGRRVEEDVVMGRVIEEEERDEGAVLWPMRLETERVGWVGERRGAHERSCWWSLESESWSVSLTFLD